jgi:hypothetical protein
LLAGLRSRRPEFGAIVKEFVEAIHLPHACQELYQTTISKSKGHDNVWLKHIPGLDIDEGQDEGGQGESAQSQRGRVRELAMCGGPVQTRLELSTEGGEPSRFASVQVGERVAAIVALDGLLAIGWAVDVGLKSVVSGLGRHCLLLFLFLGW